MSLTHKDKFLARNKPIEHMSQVWGWSGTIPHNLLPIVQGQEVFRKYPYGSLWVCPRLSSQQRKHMVKWDSFEKTCHIGTR